MKWARWGILCLLGGCSALHAPTAENTPPPFSPFRTPQTQLGPSTQSEGLAALNERAAHYQRGGASRDEAFKQAKRDTGWDGLGAPGDPSAGEDSAGGFP